MSRIHYPIKSFVETPTNQQAWDKMEPTRERAIPRVSAIKPKFSGDL